MRIWLTAAAMGLCALGATGFADAAPAEQHQAYTWSSVPFGAGGFVDGFLYHPRQKGLLYARTDIGGMYRYDYAAKRWLPLLDHLGRDDAELMGVLSMAIDPNDPARVYAATGLYTVPGARKGAILRSTDQGRTWQKTELPIGIGGNMDGRGAGERLAVDAHDGEMIYFASTQNGLWKSIDGGRTFAQANAPGKSLTLVLVDPRRSRTIYVGCSNGQGGLFISQDGGVSFQPVAGTPARQTPQRAAFASDGSLYVTFARGENEGRQVNPNYAVFGSVWKRDAATGNWRDVSPIRSGTSARFGYSGVDVGADGTVAVSTLDRWSPGDDIFVSKDGGDHWLALSGVSRHDASRYPWLVNYLRGEDKMGHWISDLKINPFDGDEMAYGTGYGLWMSRNLQLAGSGAKIEFDFNVAGLEETETLQLVAPTGGATLFAALGDVGGAAWHSLAKTPDAGLFTPASENNYSVDYAGLEPSFVARTTANDPTHGFYSVNAGIGWTAFPTSPRSASDGAQEGRNPGVIAVSAKGTAMLWASGRDAAYYSTDLGKHWRPSVGWPGGGRFFPMPISDKAIDGVFYVLDRVGRKVLISIDGGASFKTAIQGLPKLEPWQHAQLSVVPTRGRDVWLVAPFGLLHSRDANTPMSAVTSVEAAWLIGFGAPKQSGEYPAVYLWGKVHGHEGLWRSDDEGSSWTRINDSAHQFGGFSGIAGDMRDYGTIYVAPHGRGVMVGRPAK